MHTKATSKSLRALAYAQCQKLLHTLRKLTAFPFLARTQDGSVISSSLSSCSLLGCLLFVLVYILYLQF